MIVSSGYNIAGPEVEAALLSCAEVKECAVIGVADDERGQIVQAHVVLADGVMPDDATRLRLQNHVKATIAPYKYPALGGVRGGAAEDADREDPAVSVAGEGKLVRQSRGARNSLAYMERNFGGGRSNQASRLTTKTRNHEEDEPSCLRVFVVNWLA